MLEAGQEVASALMFFNLDLHFYITGTTALAFIYR